MNLRASCVIAALMTAGLVAPTPSVFASPASAPECQTAGEVFADDDLAGYTQCGEKDGTLVGVHIKCKSGYVFDNGTKRCVLIER
ncbi:hypothetical protein AB0D54_37405 [Streptomyces xanthophaeus]|uniref:hypothetical protein n=1 Tax=Streptomyces xanthophaeus TaxID=67385 RepID=UPI00343B3CFC